MLAEDEEKEVRDDVELWKEETTVGLFEGVWSLGYGGLKRVWCSYRGSIYEACLRVGRKANEATSQAGFVRVTSWPP